MDPNSPSDWLKANYEALKAQCPQPWQLKAMALYATIRRPRLMPILVPPSVHCRLAAPGAN